MTNEWATVKKFELEDRFSIAAPEGWENSHDEEVLLLLINPSVEGSGIFVDFTHVDWSGVDVKNRLVEASETFLNKSIVPNEQRALKDVVSITFGNDKAHSIRTFATFERAYVWLVQFVFWVDRQFLFILHWNGPGRLAKKVISPVFDSFEIGA